MSVPLEIAEQVASACRLITRHLGSAVEAIHLHGSALVGLKPFSDVDLLVTVNAPVDERTRRALLSELLTISAAPGEDESLRALEVTVVEHREVVPWRYPPRRELQFGEWLREDIVAGVCEPPRVDADLAILLTQVRQNSIALLGAEAEELFDPVPKRDFSMALVATLQQWKSPADWEGDERNVVLTLARIWFSAVTGQIVPKEEAAEWLLHRLPPQHRGVVHHAQQEYLGRTTRVSGALEGAGEFILLARATVEDLLVR